MGKEITVTLNVSVTNGNFKDTFSPSLGQIDQSAQGGHRPVVIVDSSAYEAVPLGDVSTPGLVYGRNLDTANYVTVAMTTSSGSTAATPFARLTAGEPFLFRADPTIATKMKWKANTADVKVDLHVLES